MFIAFVARTPVPATANELIAQQLHERLVALEGDFKSDALAIAGELVEGVDDIIRLKVEESKQRRSPRQRLTVFLTTNGGYIEAVIAGLPESYRSNERFPARHWRDLR